MGEKERVKGTVRGGGVTNKHEKKGEPLNKPTPRSLTPNTTPSPTCLALCAFIFALAR